MNMFSTSEVPFSSRLWLPQVLQPKKARSAVLGSGVAQPVGLPLLKLTDLQ